MSYSSSSVWENIDMSLNIGTCTAFKMDDSGHFKFCFMAFSASIEGWKYCRPVIPIDGIYLKSSPDVRCSHHPQVAPPAVHLQPTFLSLSLFISATAGILSVLISCFRRRQNTEGSAVVAGRGKEYTSRSKELTLKFSDLAAGLFGDSFPFLGGITEYSSKGFPTTGPRIEAENVVIHRGLHVSDYWDFMLMDLEVTVQYVVIIGLDVDHGVWTGKDSESGFGYTRLICASFGSTRLICAFYGTTRLLCRAPPNRKLTVVRAQRGADRREAGRTREGHMDASGFLIASAMYFVRIFDL
ncbi:protein FAR1-RELATED SEQUENCE 4-like [Cucumis melo var. makuwa]|uniref:Protein FAR1-RELATED SEQUENCE 4-like n=1 Tax=Cucumis melo var. makuwa TaxID=1194695 RepID=A0A5A7U8D8_CUCMM|nr:protein FAR1-RELATED SEQUENCE 4-like [Cucumis melo var. makuwa]